jgi:hypothetical protein
MKKKSWLTIIVIVAVIIFVITIRVRSNPNVDEELTKCIGENSKLYVQLGCHACETQEDLFGKNYKLLNIVDCFYEREKCIGEIEVTPTWLINNQKYRGVQSVEKLKELTGC